MREDLMTMRTTAQARIEEGLRAYMLRVYNYMASGLALTGLVAYWVSQSETALRLIFGTPLFWVVVLAPLGVVYLMGNREEKVSAGETQMLFWLLSALMGLSLASVFLVYTGASIAQVFFISTGVFGAMSLYSYTTRRDLSGTGSTLFMGLIGIVIAMAVNLFLQSAAIHFAISVVGVLVFVGLTAYDTQKIKSMYLESEAKEVQEKKAIFGALELYLDFLNLFIFLLRLFGESEE